MRRNSSVLWVYDSQLVRERRGRNHQVFCADDIPGAAQACMPFGVNIGDLGVECQTGKQRTKCFCDTVVLVRFCGQQRTRQ